MGDDRVWDRDRVEHTGHKHQFVTRIGIVAHTVDLRKSKDDKDWCRFTMFERGFRKDTGTRYNRRWTVYAFSELARFAADCLRTGDRVLVYGLERGKSPAYINSAGERVQDDDITAWDIGQSMLRNPAYSERNEPTAYVRNQRRIEEGYGPAPDYSDVPMGPPPD